MVPHPPLLEEEAGKEENAQAGGAGLSIPARAVLHTVPWDPLFLSTESSEAACSYPHCSETQLSCQPRGQKPRANLPGSMAAGVWSGEGPKPLLPSFVHLLRGDLRFVFSQSEMELTGLSGAESCYGLPEADPVCACAHAGATGVGWE